MKTSAEIIFDEMCSDDEPNEVFPKVGSTVIGYIASSKNS